MAATDDFDFAASLKELEEITAWFESEEVDLDKALAKFERGVALAAQLRQHLGAVENRVEQIKQKFETPPKSVAEDAPSQELEEDEPRLL